MKTGKSSEKNKKPKGGSPSYDEHGGSVTAPLPDFMYGVNVFFHDVAEDQKKKLTRYLVAYPFSIDLSRETFVNPSILIGV